MTSTTETLKVKHIQAIRMSRVVQHVAMLAKHGPMWTMGMMLMWAIVLCSRSIPSFPLQILIRNC